MEYYSRKSPRLAGYDYAEQNYYFITICSYNKKCIFGQPGYLNNVGKVVKKHIELLSSIYPGIIIDKYVVMPNHIHAILIFDDSASVSLSRIIGQFKMSVTKELKNTFCMDQVWQRSFHDHIIRNQKDYERIWLYIHGNPQRWSDDCFFTEPW